MGVGVRGWRRHPHPDLQRGESALSWDVATGQLLHTLGYAPYHSDSDYNDLTN